MADLNPVASHASSPKEPLRRPGVGLWILSLVWLGVAILAVALVVAWWSVVPYLVVGLLAVSAIVWILVSVLSPAIPDRTCPSVVEKVSSSSGAANPASDASSATFETNRCTSPISMSGETLRRLA